jgi:hypothetical protein
VTSKKTTNAAACACVAATPEPTEPEISYEVKHARVLLKLAARHAWKPDDIVNVDQAVIEAMYDELFPAPKPVTVTGSGGSVSINGNRSSTVTDWTFTYTPTVMNNYASGGITQYGLTSPYNWARGLTISGA